MPVRGAAIPWTAHCYLHPDPTTGASSTRQRRKWGVPQGQLPGEQRVARGAAASRKRWKLQKAP
eukprot:4680353-Alexandrium_andersonii.AAC.1